MGKMFACWLVIWNHWRSCSERCPKKLVKWLGRWGDVEKWGGGMGGRGGEVGVGGRNMYVVNCYHFQG